MSWYKLAQQQDFEFWKNDRFKYYDHSPQKSPLSIEDMDLQEAIEDCNSDQELENILKYFYNKNEIKYSYINLENNHKVVSIINGIEIFVVEIGGPNYKFTNATEWINDILWSGYIEDYTKTEDFNKEFWENIGIGDKLYHGTSDENLSNILKRGLEPRYETRGMTNQVTGDAIFMSETPDDPGGAGHFDIVLEIDVGQMKQDGYMPQVSMEEPLNEGKLAESLAWQIGIRDYCYEGDSSDGLSEGTIIMYRKIPSKYIKVVK